MKNKVPKLRFPEFSGEWEEKKIGDVCSIYDGTHQTPTYVNQGIKFVSVENIKNIDNTDKYITKEAFEKDFKIKPQKDDILMTRITAGIIGATAIVKNNNPLGYYVSLALLRKKSDIFIEFLAQYINGIQFKKELNKRIIHVAFPKKINLGDIGDCKIKTPSLPEQEKIASFLSEVDTKIEKLEKKKELLSQYKKGMMQKLFSQKLRFKDENGNDYPEWEESNLEKLAEINPKTEAVPEKFIYIDLESVEKGLLKSENIVLKNEAPSRAQRVLKSNDILYQTVRPYQKNNFYFKNMNRIYPFVASTGYAQIRTSQNSKYLYHFLHTDKFVASVLERCTGTSYPAINSSDLKLIKINIPSLPEQEKIANFLSSIDRKVELVETKLEKNKKFKKGLLQQMFV
ncbi:MAG: restriction endonuclease subunit S [Cetobacterium sp.]|uniref:restriction endonuclease subunit S n=1 Tax=Cetobacterium sp. TaxID=2071632 RepID=UPI003F2DD196